MSLKNQAFSPVRADIFFCLLDELTAPEVESWCEFLDPDELMRAAQFKVTHPRRQYIAAHALLRHVLSFVSKHHISPTDWRFDAEPQGKPRVAKPDVDRAPQFSLTHCADFVAVALSADTPIGIDAEQIRGTQVSMSDVYAFFEAAEASSVQATTSNARVLRFLELWTLKEAHVKASGTGLALPISAPAFEFRSDEIVVHLDSRTTNCPSQYLYWQTVLGDSHVVSLCLNASSPPKPLVRVWRTDLGLRSRSIVRPSRIRRSW